METVIFTMGTRGDVQPYIFLARALQERGHKVTIGTHPCWRELVQSSGAAFAAVGADISIEYEAAKIRGKAKNPAISMLKTMQFVFRMIEESSGMILEHCKGKDLVIVSHSLMGATEAEVLGIPTVNVVLQTQMIPEIKKEKRMKDKIAAALINPQMVKPYNKIRAKYGLSKLKSMDQVMSGSLTLIPISKYAAAYNPYWDEKNKLTGYWYKENPDDRLPEQLQAFLNKGEKPIALALGAMSFESGEEHEKLTKFIEAFKKTGHRAVIQGFDKTMEHCRLPDTILHIGAVPHSLLFRRCYAVIHHCGFGTAAAALIYGVPSIPVPHVLDQMGFADSLYRAGAGTKPVPAGKLSVEAVTAAINQLDGNYDKLAGSARELSEKIAGENGLETAVRLIEGQYKP